MATPAEVARFKKANAGIVRLLRRDLDAFWATLDLRRPEAARDALLDFLPLLSDTYGDVAAAVAADWYDDLREAAQVAGSFRATPAALVPADVVQARARFGAQHLWSDDPSQTLTFLSSAMTKYALQPGWDTIAESSRRDPKASGWRRVARADGCKFCRMLEGRGGVYKESTAHFASHGDCNCAAVPDWDPNAPEVDVTQYEASVRTSRMSPERREQHRQRIADYLAEMAD